MQPDKIRKSEIFTTFEKVHCSFINTLKSAATPRILPQHRLLRNLRKNKDIFITKPDKGNGVVILD